MRYIEPHIHMVSRTTDDYIDLATSGCVAVSEPAFWAGYDRCSVDGFQDYFNQLTKYEPLRAKKYGIKHYCWLCLNPKESEDLNLTREVLSLIPEYIKSPNVLGFGEIGLNRNTRNEFKALEMHIELAAKLDVLILVHTPHLEDKLKGTRLTIEAIKNESRIKPERVIIDHAEEHTVKMIKDAGFWVGLTLYPQTKCTYTRAADIIEIYGSDKIMVNSAADWGESVPMAVTYFAKEMRLRGHPDSVIEKIVYENPIKFFSQSGKFVI